MNARNAVCVGFTAPTLLTTLLLTMALAPVTRATDFTNLPISGLPQVFESAVAWADFDNDGRLDFLLTGTDGTNAFSQLWRNTGSAFTNVTNSAFPAHSLAGVRGNLAYLGYPCSQAWGDFDNDGRLDLLIAGEDTNNNPVVQLWRNTGSGFTNVTATAAPGLPQVDFGALAWGDFDNDGRLDFLITGATDYDGTPVSQLWRNTGSGFTNVPLPGVPGVLYSSVAWGDFDNDGRLDFLLTGSTNSSSPGGVFRLWRNTGSGFTTVPLPGVPGVFFSSVAWGDYDNDGRLDFLLTGYDDSGAGHSQLWRNTGSGFANVPISSQWATAAGSVVWGDYDNDGHLDFLFTGETNSSDFSGFSFLSQLWRNNGDGTFSDVTATAIPTGLPQVSVGAVASWADYDNDGRLDFLLTGSTNAVGGGLSQLWHNITPVTNAPPAAPTGLAMTASTNAVMLSWNSAVDDHTPATGLTYNVRAGTTPGGIDLLAAHVNAANGFRRVPALGNAYLRHSLPLTGVTNGETVYWSVQAVDTSFAGGPFATETSVVTIPTLFITNDSQPSTINISWAPPTFGWHLEETPTLNPAAWSASPGGEQNPATVTATNGRAFYRLKHQ